MFDRREPQLLSKLVGISVDTYSVITYHARFILTQKEALKRDPSQPHLLILSCFHFTPSLPHGAPIPTPSWGTLTCCLVYCHSPVSQPLDNLPPWKTQLFNIYKHRLSKEKACSVSPSTFPDTIIWFMSKNRSIIPSSPSLSVGRKKPTHLFIPLLLWWLIRKSSVFLKFILYLTGFSVCPPTPTLLCISSYPPGKQEKTQRVHTKAVLPKVHVWVTWRGRQMWFCAWKCASLWLLMRMAWTWKDFANTAV